MTEQRLAFPQRSPDAVYGPLHLDGSAVYRGQAVGDGQFTVIVGVDAQKGMRQAFPDRPDNGADFLRHGASVGIAQHQAVHSMFPGCPEHSQGVFRLPLEAVKKVFCVKKASSIFFLRKEMELPMISDCVPGNAQGHFHMAGAGFPKTAATRAPLDIRAASVGSVSEYGKDGACFQKRPALHALVRHLSWR